MNCNEYAKYWHSYYKINVPLQRGNPTWFTNKEKHGLNALNHRREFAVTTK